VVAHLLVGFTALGFGIVLVVAGRARDAELEGVLIGPGVVLTVVALAFLAGGLRVLRRCGADQGAGMSRILSVLELIAGVALAGGVLSSVPGGENVSAWRSPVLVPSLVLGALGGWGLWLSTRPSAPHWS